MRLVVAPYVLPASFIRKRKPSRARRTSKGLDPLLADRMRRWRHSGFSEHNRAKVQAGDTDARQRLARYLNRAIGPFNQVVAGELDPGGWTGFGT